MGGIKWRRINSTVAGVLGIHAYIYTTVVSCVIIPWFSFSVPGALHLSLLTASTALAIACLLTAVISDPGSVPAGYSPDAERQGDGIVEVKKKGGARFCQKCGHHKPPRAHHCRVCQRCVLRMDHHCPWLNNCVGHANYKTFILFLISVTAAVLHALGLLVAHALFKMRMAAAHRVTRIGPDAKVVSLPSSVAASQSASAAYRVLWAIMQTVCTAMVLPLSIGLVMLLGWNLYLLIGNKTTIEYHEGVTAQVRAARVGGEYEHPYDLGLCGNLHAVFGPDASRWCIPDRAAAAGTGLIYPTAWDPRDSG